MGHHGDPEEEEVIVLEEPERPDEGGPRVVRVPRAPTQKEIEAHDATHIPHAEWCEFCMAGRARNKPHRRRSKKTQFCTGEVDEEELEATGTPGRPVAEGTSSAEPVARVCMDYFYVSSRPDRARGAPKVEAQTMSTKELQKRLRNMGKSDKGQRSVLIERYERYAREEEQEETSDGQEAEEASEEATTRKPGCQEGTKGQRPHASDYPMMVMVDESTGNKYMRAVGHKGLGVDGDQSWLVKDMHQEL